MELDNGNIQENTGYQDRQKSAPVKD